MTDLSVALGQTEKASRSEKGIVPGLCRLLIDPRTRSYPREGRRCLSPCGSIMVPSYSIAEILPSWFGRHLESPSPPPPLRFRCHLEIGIMFPTHEFLGNSLEQMQTGIQLLGDVMDLPVFNTLMPCLDRRIAMRISGNMFHIKGGEPCCLLERRKPSFQRRKETDTYVKPGNPLQPRERSHLRSLSIDSSLLPPAMLFLPPA